MIVVGASVATKWFLSEPDHIGAPLVTADSKFVARASPQVRSLLP